MAVSMVYPAHIPPLEHVNDDDLKCFYFSNGSNGAQLGRDFLLYSGRRGVICAKIHDTLVLYFRKISLF